ncbi:MAG: Mut7-C RNAse domain-containing protein [Candidatus Bathyarchaeia archaeon]|nr:Mut7-C RNAse domain-containing protein [Candidatus Bathyarchaeota archaeon]
MKFIADSMLGKLTRWLRMLGHNVKYSNKLDDAQLIGIAKKERRILLTRDLELYQQATAKGVQAFYVDGPTETENLAKIAQKFGISLDVDMSRSRCPKCNTQVKPIPKEKVAGKVEENTYTHYNDFWECPKCGKIYWQGAHWTRIRKTLETAKELSKNAKKV